MNVKKYEVYGEISNNIVAIYYKLIDFYLEQTKLNFMAKNNIQNGLKKLKSATSEEAIEKNSDNLIFLVDKKSQKIDLQYQKLDERTINSIISSTVRLRNNSDTVQRIYDNLKTKTTSSEIIKYMINQIRIIEINQLKHLKSNEKEIEKRKSQNNKSERLYENKSLEEKGYNFEQKVSIQAPKKEISIDNIFEQIINKYLNIDITLPNIYLKLKEDFYARGINDEKYIKACFIEISNRKFSKINRVFEKNKPNISDLHKLAMTIYETLPEELMHNESAKRNNTIINGLDTYEKAYQEYVKYYQKLNKTDKNDQEFFAKRNYPDPYQAILGKKVEDFYIITPEDLRKAVNKKVSKEMKEIHYFRHLYNEENTLDIIGSPTRFMTIEEIAGIYSVIQRVNKETGVYSEEKLKRCQRNFALAILVRENKEFSKLTQTEIAEEVKIICEKYFKEESLTKVLPEKQSNKIKTEEKFYKLSKLNKTFEEISKEYPRFIELMQQEELTNKEQEELDNMFKGPRR